MAPPKTFTTPMRMEIQNRLKALKDLQVKQQAKMPLLNPQDEIVKLARVQGNIASLEWVLREDEFGS